MYARYGTEGLEYGSSRCYRMTSGKRTARTIDSLTIALVWLDMR